MLKRHRFRAHVVGNAVAAEKGYLREVGNLIFHTSLIVMLVAFAAGQLFKVEGGKLIVEGDGFSNTLTQYDDISSGSLFNMNDLAPFSFTLDKFEGTYQTSGPETGTAITFQADVHYSKGADGKERNAVIKVNKPLEIEGSKIFLISHGYAPTVTVRDSRGKVVLQGATPLLPIDTNLTSTGAIKVMDGYRDKDGKKDQLGFAALFVPTFAGKGWGRCSRAVSGTAVPGSQPGRLPRQSGCQRGHSAERVPVGHQQDDAVQGLQGRHPRADSAAWGDHETAEWRRLHHHGQRDQTMGEFPDHPSARGRLCAGRRDRRYRGCSPVPCSSGVAGSGSGRNGARTASP